MKRIVVIAGVTGSIGSALLSEFAQNSENVIYGISRKAEHVEHFLKDGKLPHKTLICGLTIPEEYELLFSKMNYNDIDEILYIHAVGLYPFEVNKNGEIVTDNDTDGDGINDEVRKLTFTAISNAVRSLQNHFSGKIKICLFGAIADKYKPAVHHSWWKTIEKTKSFLQEVSSKNQNITSTLFNISSVLCPHEIITRPFVFIHTDADQTKWLHPYELSQFVYATVQTIAPGFHEFEKFRIKDDFEPEQYYKDESFTPRKVEELYE